MKNAFCFSVKFLLVLFFLFSGCSSTSSAFEGNSQPNSSEASLPIQTSEQDSDDYSQASNREKLIGTWLLEDGGFDNKFSYITFNPDGTFSLVAETNVYYMDMGAVMEEGQEISGEYEHIDILHHRVNLNVLLIFNTGQTEQEYPLKYTISENDDTMELIINWHAKSTYRRKE